MLIKKPSDISSSEITDERIYHARRRFMGAAGGLALAAAAPALFTPREGAAKPALLATKLKGATAGPFSVDVRPNTFEQISTYNNFYEFGTDKRSPARLAPDNLQTHPWSVAVEGECNKPGEYDFEDILRPHPLEERIYRFRCVEAWSMVVPWVGFPLGDLLKRFEPTSKAKYVEFTTLHDPAQMTGQNRPILEWPYVEGLRIDEAMHPLSLMVVGLYGKVLPHQNGAPLRLIVPWKYGFKSIKSIVRIRFTEKEPRTAWNVSAPHEYGFYANVNPNVDHPRWSQKRERRLGDSIFAGKRDTLMFNGYGEQVAHLYAGMDLRKYF